MIKFGTMSKKSKKSKYIAVGEHVPEWGVSPRVSLAIPIVLSKEIKSTRDISEAIVTVLRSRLKKLKEKDLDAKDVKQLRNIVAKAKRGHNVRISFEEPTAKNRDKIAARTRRPYGLALGGTARPASKRRVSRAV